MYATYGFTLSAILPGYGLNLAFTETVWGMFLYTMATLVTQYLTSN
jgi:uncharacterized membrane protein